MTTILAFLEAGYVDHLLLSSDFANGRALKKNGGPGIAQTLTVFGPMLLKAGVSEGDAAHDPGRQPPPLPRLRPARPEGPGSIVRLSASRAEPHVHANSP